MVNRLFNRASACFAVALALSLPFAAKAVDYTGTDYAPWSYSAGCVAWRATSGQLFHASTVADVAADGTIGAEYTFGTSGHPWQIFASNQSAYTSPGATLVFDKAGYNNNSDAQFAPMSFGGLWVKALQADGTPYCITDNKTDGTDRTVELGATGASSYFKFDKSFTFNRNSATAVKGEATVEIASGATFTINARAGKGAVVDSGNTLVLKGAGTLAVVGGLTVSGTLDLSASTCPTISGDVTFAAGATIVLPAGTEPTAGSPFSVCSGTLTVDGDMFVKIGSAAAAIATVTFSGGSITGYTPQSAEVTYEDNWPSVVPIGYIYTFVGGATPDAAVAVPSGVEVNGTLRTTGYISLVDLKINTGGKLEVVDGSTTAAAATYGSYGDKQILGNIIVRAGATFAPTQTDFLDWAGATDQTIDIYGTLAMGGTRWSIKSNANCKINLYPGAHVTGTGDSNGVFDLINSASKLNVYPGDNGGEVIIDGVVKTRNANTPIWVAANTTLKIGGLNAGGVNKSGDGTLEISGTISNPAASTVSEGTFAFVDTTVAVPLTVNAGKTITASASTGVTVPLNATLAANANIAVSGAGTVNGTVVLGGKPGTATGLDTSTWKGTVELAAIAAGNTSTQVPLQSYGNAESSLVLAGISGNTWLANGNAAINAAVTVNGAVGFKNGKSGATYTFTNIAGGSGNLSFATWSGCTGLTYGFTTLDADNYTGTIALDGSVMTFNVGNILKTGAEEGEKVLNLTTANGATVNLAGAKLNGVATNLVAKADGIYIKGKTATIAYPGGTTVDSYADLNTILISLFVNYTPAKAGAVVTVLDGSDETFVDSAEVIESLYDYDPANHTYTLKTMVASVTYVDGGQTKTRCVPYIDVVAQAAEHYDVTATLLVDLDMSSLESGITIPAGLYAITFDLGGKTITGPANGYAFVNGGGKVTITGEGTVAGAGIVSNATSSAVTVISNGTYSATGDLFAKDPDSSLTVSGGTFNKTFDETYLDEGMELHGNNGGYDVREAKGWVYEAAGYKEYTGTWSGDIEYDVATGKARIENGNTYTAETASDGRMVTLDMTFGFDAINVEDDEIADAKAAVRLGAGANEGEFVFQLYTSDGDGSKWVDVTASGVTATTNVEFNFVFVLDMTNKTYTVKVDNATLTDGSSARFAFGGASATTEVRSVQFTGAGLFTSLIGSYEELTGFAEGQTFNNGAVTLTGLEADWLNGQNNFAGLSDMLNSLTQKALDTAYLLNLNVLDENYDGSYTFTVTNIEFGKDGDENETVVVTVGLTRKGALDGGINGTLKLKGGTELGTEFSVLDQVTIVDADFSDGDSTTCTFQKGDAPAKFYQAVIEPVMVE